jgi:transcriptional regulator with XRE-family HTH domain
MAMLLIIRSIASIVQPIEQIIKGILALYLLHVFANRFAIAVQERKAMNAWGLKIQELLDRHDMKPSKLAKDAGVSRSTVGNWLHNPDGVTPKPLQVAKVAKAFGLKTRELAPFAGYPINASADDTERTARRAALVETPRVAELVRGLERLGAKDQDTVLSMLEAFIASRR